MTNIVTYPTNPVQGQEFTVGETIKIWDGEKWVNKTPTNNPHNVTKAQVGLGNVDDVSSSDLRDRSTHTGTQTLSTISDAGSAASKDVGVSGGVASLNVSGKVPDSESQVSSVNDMKGDVVLTASDIISDSGTSTQQFIDSFALKIFQSPTNGGLTEIQTRTVNANEVYEVRKTSDDSLATIYSDAAGTTEIVQNGTSNVSDSDGVVEFYIADGDYTVTINAVSGGFRTFTHKELSGLNAGGGHDPIYSRKFETVQDMIDYTGHDVGLTYMCAGLMWSVKSTPVSSVDNIIALTDPSNGEFHASEYEYMLRARQLYKIRNVEAPLLKSPKVNATVEIVSEIEKTGQPKKGFVSACFYGDNDYVFYRSGTGHLEKTPLTNTSSLVVAKYNPNSRVSENTTVYAGNSSDPRDPSVLRDSYGEVILVGGMFKVLFFEWDNDYSVESNASIKIGDLDPNNVSAGLTNIVTVPQVNGNAARTDFRMLSTGEYSFISYSGSNCYQVSTTDFLTFSYELVGRGNEAAFCETSNGELNVVARGEEAFGERCTIWYKKTTGGSWSYYDVINETLDAPTFTKVYSYVASGYTDPGDGWILIARRKKQKTLSSTDNGDAELVCFRSKQSHGTVITKFDDYKILDGNNGQNVANADAHYASAVCRGKRVMVYSYKQFSQSIGVSTTSLQHCVYTIPMEWNSGGGLESISPDDTNTVLNGSFIYGGAYWRLDGVKSIVSHSIDAGKNTLKLTGLQSPSLRGLMSVKQNKTYFGSARLRLLPVSNTDRTGLSIKVITSTGETLQSTTILAPYSDFGDGFFTVNLLPFKSTSTDDNLLLQVECNNANADFEIDYISYSENQNQSNITPRELKNTISDRTALSIGTGSGAGAQTGSVTYSSAIWSIFGFDVIDSKPINSESIEGLSIIFDSAFTQSGSVPVVIDSYTINSNYSVTIGFSINQAYTSSISYPLQLNAVALAKL